METGDVAAMPDQAPPAVRFTAVGLFEDTIDAEHALIALRKADHAADRVSLLVRDKAAEAGNADRTGAVGRAVMTSALEAVGGWLHGLASLIVPERGTYLVAGPIGAALAGISATDARPAAGASTGGPSYAAAGDLGAGGLRRTLVEFGYTPDEATYLEHRLAAGEALVAVTTNDQDALQATRRLFADHDAIYIGMAQTDAGFFREAEALLHAAPEASSGGDVVVTDAVAPLLKVSREEGPPEALAFCGRAVVDSEGNDAGSVTSVLVEEVAPGGPAGREPAKPVVRYVVVGFGGLLGLGRRHVAVPAGMADLDAVPIRLDFAKTVLHQAPAYDDDAPFSRREEQTVCAYFGCSPYWFTT